MAYMAKLAGKPGDVEDNLMSIDEDQEHKPLYDEFRLTGKVDPTAADNEDEFFKYLSEHRKANPGDYDDQNVYLSVNDRTLTLKHWLISHPILVIEVEKIIYLRPAPDVVFDDFGVKVWGIGETGVGWARDGNRKGSHPALRLGTRILEDVRSLYTETEEVGERQSALLYDTWKEVNGSVSRLPCTVAPFRVILRGVSYVGPSWPSIRPCWA
ncbi:hypothetical protein CALVIDRAFT_59540 [Calocera viscosa TUFC12733]|uniref:Uncharacterized protein n=1 Tax=Calocera viscosa (strain TUFC12733) TaxID=1330018 RepID=A0A167NIJ6_CALVF|nr:hypothetical protein CALVIDRAFT_59540 [Calocera viscosa TUFC12733]